MSDPTLSSPSTLDSTEAIASDGPTDSQAAHSDTAIAEATEATSPDAPAEPEEPAPSYVKLAMRNMVRKGGKSIFHFVLTTTGLIGLFIGLAYLTR